MSYRIAFAVLALSVMASCHDDPSIDGSGIIVTELSPQPESTSSGILLAIHARGGGSLAVAVDRGTFISPFDVPPDGGTIAAQTFRCFEATSGSTGNGLFSIELSVTPKESELLLYLILYNSMNCQGFEIENRVIPVNKPGSNSDIDAGTAAIDAEVSDARAVDAGVSDAQ